MLVIVDGKKIVQRKALNFVKVVITDDDGIARHITVTDEGIIIDLVKEGEIVATTSYGHVHLLEQP